MPISNRIAAPSLTTALAAALSMAAPAAQANSPNQANLPGTSLFAVAAGGNGTGGFANGGESIFIDPPNPGNYGTFNAGSHSEQVATSGSVSASKSYSLLWPSGNPPVNLPYSGNATASASFSTMHLFATNQGANSVYFPTAMAQAGWTDQLTITAPGKSGAGLMQFQVGVDGTLTADNGARPGFWITPYINHDLVALNGSFSAANPHPVIGSLSSVGYQTRIWWLPAGGSPASLHVNETVNFFVPFTFGQTFSLGLYADAIAGNGSYGGGPLSPVSHATSDFSHTLHWLGVSGVTSGGGAVNGYSIGSASGTNWAVSTVPEPASAVLLMAGMVLLMSLRRRGPRRRTATLAATGFALTALATGAQANSPSQANQTGTSVFAVAAGGNGFGSWPEGGAELVVDTNFIPGIYGVFGPGSSYNSMLLPTTGNVHAQNVFALSSIWNSLPPQTLHDTGSATASASFLPSGVLPDSAPIFQMHLSATNTGPTAIYFPLSVAQAGVTDQLTIHQAGMSGAGLLPVLFHVDGTLSADGRGDASFIVTPYVNHQVVNNNTAYVNANPNLGYSIGYQTAQWGLAADGPVQSRVVNQNFEFFVPFTFDQSFSFGLYADAIAANAAYGGGLADSHASADFSHTLTWLGTGPVQAGGQSLTNYSIQSASGVNWALPSAVPEPGKPVLLAAGLGWLMLRRRRQP